MMRLLLICVAATVAVMTIALSPSLLAQSADSSEIPTATVGARGSVKDVILPGSELVAKPIAGDPAMIVQVVDAIPHGDSFRYELRFSGLEPGDYDLTQWMVRKDATEIGTLPAVAVKIESLLPPGQVVPNELETGWIPRLGGYQNILTLAIIFWIVILLLLIFGGRKKKANDVDDVEKPLSLAELLQQRLQAGFDNQVEPGHYAELERMLFAYWRRKLSLESVSTEEALVKIKRDETAGPLMVQMERWLHQPNSDKEVDLAALLEPYRNISASDFESGNLEATKV